jgi:DNA-binding MarR family transcriptional regulator
MSKMARPAGAAYKPPAAASVPAVGEGKRGEAGYLGYLLRQAAAAYRLRLERALADLGVTPPQFAVLTMIKAYPGLSNADLARLTLLTPQTVSVIVANLLRDGALERRAHAVHGRILQLDLTAAGRAVLAKSRARALALERDLKAGLGKAEEVAVRRFLVAAARGGEG